MTLQQKVLAVLLPLSLATCAAILKLSNGAVEAVLIDAAGAAGRRALEEAAAGLAARPDSLSEKALLPILHKCVASARGSYAMALDERGVVLAHTNVVETGRLKSDLVTRAALASAGPEAALAQDSDGETLDVSMPVWRPEEDFLLAQERGGRRRLATLRLGLPLREAKATRKRIQTRLASILGVTFLIGALLVTTIFRTMLAPIRLLSATAAEIGRGRYDIRVPIGSNDELGDLAASFNRMSESLAETTVSKEYMDGVFQSIVDPLIVTDPGGSIRTINRACAAVLGLPEEKVLGRPVKRFLEASPFSGNSWAPSTDLSKAKDLELVLRGEGGRQIPALLSGSPLKGAGGRTEGIVIVAKDLSERKRLEAMLLQSEKLSAVGQLAAGVAHEINNPLGIILGFAQSATRRLEESHALSLPLRSIEREALRCRNLVQSLLTFSRRNLGVFESLDLSEVVGGSLTIVEAQAKVKGVEVVRELADAIRLIGDKNQLQQIVVNLCSNAIDALPGGGRVVVRTRLEGQGGRAVLEVEDNGVGIPETIRARLFEPFFTTKEVGKGTGLGLALVYEIVQKHRGSIQVRSEVGRGAAFIIELPLGDTRSGGGA